MSDAIKTNSRCTRGGLPEMWISGGQMSGEEDGTGDGSSVQICKENTATRIKQRLRRLVSTLLTQPSN